MLTYLEQVWQQRQWSAAGAQCLTGVCDARVSWLPGLSARCFHGCAGGRGVIDAIEKQLELSPGHVAASREALFRYGNTSSASIW